MRCIDCAGSGVVAAHGLEHISCPECDGQGHKTLSPERLNIATRLADLRAHGAATLVSAVDADQWLVSGRLMGYVVGMEDCDTGKREHEIIRLCNRVILMIRDEK